MKKTYFVGLGTLILLGLSTSVFGYSVQDICAYYTFDGNYQDNTGNERDLYVIAGSPTSVGDCKNNGCYYYDGVGDAFQNDTFGCISSTDNYTISGWINTTSTAGTNVFWSSQDDGATNDRYELRMDDGSSGKWEALHYVDGVESDVLSNAVPSINTWYHIVQRYNEATTTLEMWVNGVKQTDTDATSGTTSNLGSFTFCRFGNGAGWECEGRIDEVGIWNRHLSDSEISDLYNGGAGDFSPESPPENDVTYNIIDYYTQTTINNFTINISGGYSNSTTSGTVQFSNTSATNGTVISINITSNESGGYLRYVGEIPFIHATTETLAIWQSELLINATEVIVNTPLTSFNGSGLFQFNESNSTGTVRLLLNASTHTINLASHGYDNQTLTFTTTPGVINQTSVSFGNSVNFTALDRRTSTAISSFTVNVSMQGQSFNQSVTNGSIVFLLPNRMANVTILNGSLGQSRYETIMSSGNIITNLPNFTISNPSLNQLETSYVTFSLSVTTQDHNQYGSYALYFNNSNYTSAASTSGGITTYTISLTLPQVDEISKAFNVTWNYTFNGQNLNTELYTLTISEVILSSCSAPGGDGNYTINFSIWNENNVTQSLNAGVQAEIYAYGINRNNRVKYNFDLTGSNNYLFCLKPANATIQSDAFFSYTTTPGFTHKYYYNNQSLSNSTLLTINAYNFNGTIGLSDLTGILRKRSDFREFSDVFVQLERQYVGEGVWRIVQMDKSGELGGVFFNILEESTNYRFVMKNENNTILRETTSMSFVCVDGVCTVTFLIDETGGDSGDTDVVYSTTFDNTTGLLTVELDDKNGVTEKFTVIVTKETFSTYTTICREELSAVSGTVNCDTSSYSPPFFVTVLQEASPEIYTFREMVGNQANVLRDYIGGVAAAAMYGGLILVAIGTAGFGGGAVVATTFLVAGITGLSLLGVFGFLTPAMLIALAIIMVVIISRVRGA